MKFTIVSGSHRKDSNSEKVARYLKTSLLKMHSEDEVTIISLAGNPLPLWDESVWSGEGELVELWKPYKSLLSEAEGLILVTPEWHGMVPAALKNFLLFCSADLVGYKATLPVSVTTGVGGVYPINELRTSGYKNSRLAYTPEHLIVRHVNDRFEGDDPQSEEDAELRKRTDYALKVFREYTAALNSVRESGVVNHEEFANGM